MISESWSPIDSEDERQCNCNARLTDVAFLRADAGQPDLAFAVLEAAAALEDPYLVFLPWLPYCDPLCDVPRWPRLLERVWLVR
jgi:hypothetical protein